MKKEDVRIKKRVAILSAKRAGVMSGSKTEVIHIR